MRNLLKVILLLLTIGLCSCGPIDEDNSSQSPKITIYVRDDSFFERNKEIAITTVNNITKKETNKNDLQEIKIEPIAVIDVSDVLTVTTTSEPATTTTTTTKAVESTTTTIPSEIEVQEQENYRLPYVLSENDWIDICKVVSSETGYCGEKQQKAVANTIFNRIIWANQYGHLNPYPKDIYSILRQKNQYNAIYHWSMRASRDSRLGYDGSLWNQTMKYIKEAAYEPDFTNGAIGYYNPSMSGYLAAFENNKALLLSYADNAGRFFRLNPNCYTRK